jgi:hypothetical protein
MMMRYILTGCLVLGFLFLACGKGAEDTSVSFLTLAKGTWSGPKEPTDMVFKGEAELADVWKTLSNQPDKPVPMPAVDFTAEMVIGAFAGFKPSSGFSTEIKSIEVKGDELHVQVVDTKPSPGAMTMDIVTYPYHIVKVTKSDMPVKFFHSEALGKVEGAKEVEESEK